VKRIGGWILDQLVLVALVIATLFIALWFYLEEKLCMSDLHYVFGVVSGITIGWIIWG
jgi:hypothetical protein